MLWNLSNTTLKPLLIVVLKEPHPNEFAPLFREADFLLREELRDVENYYAILTAISAGHRTNLKIAERSGIPERSLHYYLQQLITLGYVAKRYPLTEKAPVARHVRYSIEDPLLRFWFRFVFTNMSFIQRMGPQQALRERIKPHLEAYYGMCFERFCREALPLIYKKEGLQAAFEVGEYWDKETQIDVLGLRDDAWTDLGECKWGPVRSYKVLAEELERKIRSYPNSRNATIGRRVFLKNDPGSKIKRDMNTISWHSLESLYKLNSS